MGAAPKFDLIDAHYFYPDGVAAARLAKELNIPLLITGRGTDLTLIPQSPPERAQIQWAGKPGQRPDHGLRRSAAKAGGAGRTGRRAW